MPAPMTEMQQQFAVEYAINGGDATQAAIAAGYSEKSACDLGRRTAALPHVQAAILSELVRIRFRSGAIGLNAMIQVAISDKVPAAPLAYPLRAPSWSTQAYWAPQRKSSTEETKRKIAGMSWTMWPC